MRINFDSSSVVLGGTIRKDPSTERTPAHSALTLVQIPKSIPRELVAVSGTNVKAWGYLLKAMNAQGLVTPDLLSLSSKAGWTIPKIAAAAFHDWVTSACGDLQTINIEVILAESPPLGFDLTSYSTMDNTLKEEVYKRDQVDQHKPHLFLTFEEPSRQLSDVIIRVLKPTYIALEGDYPGLFHTACHALYSLLGMTIPAITPSHLLFIASMHYWRGEDNEREVIAEFEAEGLKEEEIDDIVCYTRKMFDTSFGAAAQHPNRNRALTNSALKEIAQNAPSELARELASAVVAASAMCKKANEELFPSVRDIGTETTGFCSVIRWDENDHTHRIFDDYMNGQMESGEYIESFGTRAFQMCSVEDAGLFIKQITKMFPMLRALERLIAVLTQPET